MADVENEISKDVLEIANATTRVRSLQDILNNINSVIYQKNDTISKIENEIVKRNAVIEKKQGTIDQLNKKIDSLLSKHGVSMGKCGVEENNVFYIEKMSQFVIVQALLAIDSIRFNN